MWKMLGPRNIPIVLDFDYIRWEEFCLDDVQLHVACAETDYLVQGVDDARTHKEYPEPVTGGESCTPLWASNRHNMKTI